MGVSRTRSACLSICLITNDGADDHLHSVNCQAKHCRWKVHTIFPVLLTNSRSYWSDWAGNQNLGLNSPIVWRAHTALRSTKHDGDAKPPRFRVATQLVRTAIFFLTQYPIFLQCDLQSCVIVAYRRRYQAKPRVTFGLGTCIRQCGRKSAKYLQMGQIRVLRVIMLKYRRRTSNK